MSGRRNRLGEFAPAAARRGRRNSLGEFATEIPRELVIEIYRTPGRCFELARKFGVSKATVTHIKRGDRHSQTIREYLEACRVNGFLVSVACGDYGA